MFESKIFIIWAKIIINHNCHLFSKKLYGISVSFNVIFPKRQSKEKHNFEINGRRFVFYMMAWRETSLHLMENGIHSQPSAIMTLATSSLPVYSIQWPQSIVSSACLPSGFHNKITRNESKGKSLPNLVYSPITLGFLYTQE